MDYNGIDDQESNHLHLLNNGNQCQCEIVFISRSEIIGEYDRYLWLDSLHLLRIVFILDPHNRDQHLIQNQAFTSIECSNIILDYLQYYTIHIRIGIIAIIMFQVCVIHLHM